MGWAFFYMFVILKIPLVAACLLIWWAVKQTDEPEQVDDTGGGGPDNPHHPRRPRPRPPRRGEHAETPPRPPARVRARGRRVRTVH